MIKVDKIRVFNFEGAFRGLRNPLESHDKADSVFGIAEDWEEMYELAYEVANSYITNDWWQPGDDELFGEKRDWLIEQGTRYVLSSDHATEVNYLGEREEMLALAKKRLADLLPRFPKARIVDAPEVNVFYVLAEEPEHYHEYASFG